MEEDDGDRCSKCGASESSALNMSGEGYLLSECGHRFCPQCIQREKKTFPCPKCSFMVKAHTLTSKTLDDIEIQRDANIRKKMREVFNKIEADFQNPNDFKQYEEMVEDVIFNLVHGIDVVSTNAFIEKYKKENAESIARNHARDIDAMNKMRARLLEEKYFHEQQMLAHQVFIH